MRKNIKWSLIMNDVTNNDDSNKDSQLEKLTQSFLRKIKELEASRPQRDNLKEDIRKSISEEKF
jgi:hypothetical protein